LHIGSLGLSPYDPGFISPQCVIALPRPIPPLFEAWNPLSHLPKMIQRSAAASSLPMPFLGAVVEAPLLYSLFPPSPPSPLELLFPSGLVPASGFFRKAKIAPTRPPSPLLFDPSSFSFFANVAIVFRLSS